MRKIFLLALLFVCFSPVMARHIAGGELFYEYVKPGTGVNTSTYRITLRLFRDCDSPGPFLDVEKVTVGIYELNNLRNSLSLNIQGSVRTITLNTASFPCLSGSPVVCYQIALYSNTIDLPNNTAGYTLSRLGCCRVDGITNLGGARNIGSNYVTRIPGSNALPIGINNSPQFNVKDTALVCSGKKFTLDFGALDPDNDDLTYNFCEAYGASSGSNNAPPPNQLSLDPLFYSSGFSGYSPLGPNVKINPTNGIISGIAPASGSYVVNVCITEWRNGKAFNEHRKDFILKVQDCDLIEASLPEKTIQCDSFTVHFENLSTSSGITSYLWDFGSPNQADNFSSNAIVDHKYADTGRYKARLEITGPRGCIGIDSTIVIVYPGFYPNLKITGTCVQNPYQFTDISTTKYGTISARFWNFGDESTEADTSLLKSAQYKYATPALRTAQLTVESSKGCLSTITSPVDVGAEPILLLPFRDTLICSIDTLMLSVSGQGIFSWLPNKNILNPNTVNPLVFPKTTTTYFVNTNDNGCIGRDSVKVNVLSSINVNLGPDSVICKTDTFHLHAYSEGLGFKWKASTNEIVNNLKFPLVQPLNNTQYKVFANLGKCTAEDSISIRVVPYPKAAAGTDVMICLGFKTTLQGNIVGSTYKWTPTNSLINASSLQPIAGPSKTTAYILTVSDTLGCPKPVSDTVLVELFPIIIANAGNDTSVVVDQPLQLNATGGSIYKWSPSTGLSDPNIANPIAILGSDIDSIKYKVVVSSIAGCSGTDEITVRVFKSGPEIYVPTAFTPNSDQRNDILKPITVGISKLNYFSVYNRWGQCVFTTNEFNKGWNGIFNGNKEGTGTYVFIAEGVDYLGKTIYRKGTTVLIR